MTAPGVAAMLTPTSKPVLSTCEGHPPLWMMSPSIFFAPLTTLLPPVSNARRRAAGLPGNMLVGERASTMNRPANRALISWAPFSSAASSSSSTIWLLNRYSWASRQYSGLSTNAGSRNRLSEGASDTGPDSSIPTARAPAARTAAARPIANRPLAAAVPAGFLANAPPALTSERRNATGSAPTSGSSAIPRRSRTDRLTDSKPLTADSKLLAELMMSNSPNRPLSQESLVTHGRVESGFGVGVPDIASVDTKQCVALRFCEPPVGPDRVLGRLVVQVFGWIDQAGLFEQGLGRHVQRLADGLEYPYGWLVQPALDLA